MASGFAASWLGTRLRLLRFSNIFSPAADVLSGAALARAALLSRDPAVAPLPSPTDARLALAAIASVSIYHAGMVFNDVADRREDVATRPDRPIPSGSVPVAEAVLMGTFFTILSLSLAWVAGTVLIAFPLAAVVLVYDFVTKRGSAAGPLFLGLARALNVLAGAAAVDATWLRATLQNLQFTPVHAVAAGYGLAICGLSIFAIQEDRPFSRMRSTVAAVLALAGIGIAFQPLPDGALALAWIPLVEPLSVIFGPARSWNSARVGMLVGAGLRSTLLFHALAAYSVGVPAVAGFCGFGYLAARAMARVIPPN
jgi:4-hydroxybenzoate polyprenyltransferase